MIINIKKFSKKQQDRFARLLPDNKPRYIRVYDDPYCGDRYTVCYTGKYKKFQDPHQGQRVNHFTAMNSTPFHPQGICLHQESQEPIDKPGYSHLGKKITFEDLPKDCQKVVIQDYLYYWNFTDVHSNPLNN